MKKVSLVVLAALLALTMVACGPAKPKSIKIGSLQPLTGPVAQFGEASKKAAELAVKEINAAGGVLGIPLELITEDDEANPEKSITAYTKLVEQDKVIAIVGALTSKCSLAVAPKAQEDGIPMVSHTATNEKVTEVGDYIFRACFLDPFQGKVVAQFGYTDLQAKVAAVLYDNSNDYSKGLFDSFKASFEALGGTVVAESYTEGDKDFAAQITKIKSANPQILFLPDYYSTVSLIAKQVRAQGLTIPMLGGDGWDGVEANAGDEVIGSFYSNHYSPVSDDTEVKSFVAAYEAAYGETPSALAALAYDAVKIIAAGITKAGKLDKPAIRDAIAATNGKFVTGNISYDAKRNPVKPAVIVEIVKVDGKLTTAYKTSINP